MSRAMIFLAGNVTQSIISIYVRRYDEVSGVWLLKYDMHKKYHRNNTHSERNEHAFAGMLGQ